ncbi:TPA: hypothetical protein M2P26_004757 [Klebsiella variicola]|nr:hypothetical protein [Klebsiella variicola]
MKIYFSDNVINNSHLNIDTALLRRRHPVARAGIQRLLASKSSDFADFIKKLSFRVSFFKRQCTAIMHTQKIQFYNSVDGDEAHD